MKTLKPIIHFAHANGIPSKVYQHLFDLLAPDYEIIFTPLIGPDRRYPIDQHWKSLVQQVIDSIVQQSAGRPVIGLGHSLGAVLTYLAAQQRPELFSQIILLDPAFIMGKVALAFDVAKHFPQHWSDRLSPAGLSKYRRDHWESRQQAAELLRPKALYKNFDAHCFDDFLRYALTDDVVRGGVTLTIPKKDEVEIFRTNPSYWWRVWQAAPKVKAQILVGRESVFYQQKFTHLVQRHLNIPFSVTGGGHMFPLEFPKQTVMQIRELIEQ
ncbi:alpha/beta hydrolase [Acinetobacter sp. MD2(2019)]|uniref:alpha/beta hydrolase n=1 Tax=Acinetobacter sp. MD2(2019) TaxID=2605273 RepID=UPI002D1E6468|nr:alpha/beta hydrolase [Acinetobacter sp. MD2(2019)]MEB3753474.1 alpha/beta hydrolase [Acinetobacter sp. MD2(2019)]